MNFKQTFMIIGVLTLIQKPNGVTSLTELDAQSCIETEEEIIALRDIGAVITSLKAVAGFKLRGDKGGTESVKYLNMAVSAQGLINDLIRIYPKECAFTKLFTAILKNLNGLKIDDMVKNINTLQAAVSKVTEFKDKSRESDIMKSIKSRKTYISYDEMVGILKDLAKEYPSQMSMYSIGESGEGKQIWVMAVSANKPDEHVLLRPEMKYVGGIHGNEPIGGQLLIRFLAHLGQNFGKDDTITKLMNTSRLHILPMLNPDGYTKGYTENTDTSDTDNIINACLGNGEGRNTTEPNEVDLNRNFGPEYFEKKYRPKPAKETQAVKKWLEDYPFLMSLSFHGGAMVASYPYDNKRTRKSESNDVFKYSKSPDDDIFRQMALTYSYSHGRMYAGEVLSKAFCYMGNFIDGITNGAKWFYVKGGMQDYNYVNYGILAITIEMECCKFPPYITMEDFWHENLPSFLNSWKFVHRGIKGIISDSQGNPVPNAKVYIDKRKHPVTSTSKGEYWRVLLPGTYTIRVEAEGYRKFKKEIIVHDPDLFGASMVNIIL
ncbi:unnamed protein product [Owenia fusiformis]|uniref:Peptidase M14 domain-containing protein n=1 Tax=Owenia fusiformis TaxID=6347 RepID=A0A8S4N772_OWEFU|nr:unnamed protein product [Owenia fusiformis]